MQDDVPVGTVYIAPSVTTYFNRNPAFRVYQLRNNTAGAETALAAPGLGQESPRFELVDFDQVSTPPFRHHRPCGHLSAPR